MKKSSAFKIVVGVLICLFAAHMTLSWQYRNRVVLNARTEARQFYVFTPDAYRLMAIGMDDLASRLALLYAFYTPVNINVPSIDFNRLTKALDSVVALDPDNIQPYLHIAFYWSWAKNEESRRYMAAFMEPGVEKFPKNWDIPYSMYQLLANVDNESAMTYMQTAAERAAIYNGPAWMVNFPAIWMNNQGETMGALMWLVETYKKANSGSHREMIGEQIEALLEILEAEGISLRDTME